jgi:hypothetical protein
MSLSVRKLEKFLSKYEMVPNNFFVDKSGMCVYLEVFTIKNNNSFILYLPKKYRMVVNYTTNVFQINKHKIDESGDLLDKFTDKSFVKSTEAGYDEISIQKHLGVSKNIELQTTEKYNRPIIITEKENETMKGMYRQTKRLGMCVQGTKYGICTISSTHMYCANKDNTIDGFSVNSDDSKHKYRKFLVMIDLEVLYAKIKNIVYDITDIKASITNIIVKNLSKHVSIIEKTMIGYDIKRHENFVIKKIDEYKTRLTDVENTLKQLLNTETKILEKRSDAENEINMTVKKGIKRDMEINKQMKVYDTKLQDIINVKKELFRNIVSLKIKHDNVVLISDDIFFDITVMHESIANKMNLLDQM